VSWSGLAGAALLGLLLLVALNGFLVVQPNQAKVAVFLGRYMGTVRRSGFHWVNPLTTRRTLSLRLRPPARARGRRGYRSIRPPS
jgi:regulator of protease activity HflC (stomatin/prohibitin superfamily)